MSTGGPEPQQDDPLDDPASYGVEGSAVERPNPGKGSLRRQAFPPCLQVDEGPNAFEAGVATLLDSFPLWAWYQWQSASKKRPDLRFSAHLPSGETGVLIEFLAEADEVLLSDFELWHYVLNYLYLPSSTRDEARFDSALASFAANTPSEVANRHRAFHQDVRESWDRIFDTRWSQRDIASSFTRKTIQATLWRLNRKQVRNWATFKAR